MVKVKIILKVMQISEEIKSRLDIVDVIKEYVQLKPVGANFSASSPFNREKTPSFMVSPEKQIWHCFSSGKGGDVITFIMEIEGVNFVEALRILAPKAGVTLKKEDPKVVSKRNKLMDINELAANYYHRVLMESSVAGEARGYLTERKLSQETLIDWKIGFSPNSWEDLVNFLKKKGYKEEEIISAGLANRRKGGNGIYNRFRDRIMFPLCDYNGNVVAFSARVRPGKEKEEIMGKYINSPQTMIYDKSRILFGLDKAKKEIKSEGYTVVMEGQMDVITAHQNGFGNTVASSGTALTREQLKLLKRYSSNLVLAFDMDQAGQMAVDRGVNQALPLDMKLKIITMEEDKDPDDIIRENPEKWKEILSSAREIMEYYFDKVCSEVEIGELEGKREAARRLLPLINKISDLIAKDHWLKRLSQKLDVEESLLRESLSSLKKDNYSNETEEEQEAPRPRESGPSSREEAASLNLLAIILQFPDFLSFILERIEMDQIQGKRAKQIYKNLFLYYNNKKEDSENSFDYSEFKQFLKTRFSFSEEDEEYSNSDLRDQIEFLDKLAVQGERDYYGLEEREVKSEVLKIINLLKKGNIRERMREIEKLIKDSEKGEDKKETDELLAELKDLTEELKELEKQEYF